MHECITISIPKTIGFYKIGVANVLSITEIKLKDDASYPRRYISHILSKGLVGDSNQIIFVLELMFALISSGSHISTLDNSIPYLSKYYLIKRFVPPYIFYMTIKWSPLCNSPKTELIAEQPDEKDMPNLLYSRFFIIFSKCETVGFPPLIYVAWFLLFWEEEK